MCHIEIISKKEVFQKSMFIPERKHLQKLFVKNDLIFSYIENMKLLKTIFFLFEYNFLEEIR